METLSQKLFHERILDAALDFGSSKALTDVETGKSLSFYDLRNCSYTLANYLVTEYNLQKNDIIICFMPNNIYYPIIFLACALIGSPMCGVCSNTTKDELKAIIDQTKCRAIFTTSDLLVNVETESNEVEFPIFVLDKLFNQKGIDLRDLIENASDFNSVSKTTSKFHLRKKYF